jgi:hypothetical protein
MVLTSLLESKSLALGTGLGGVQIFIFGNGAEVQLGKLWLRSQI